MEKKKQAAVAAVMHYLACEKEALAAQEAGETYEPEAKALQAVPSPPGGVHPWALSGRQQQMQMRTMMQMKAFHF
ncbi:MAG: hypothetical protein ACLFMN_00375 [Desulfobacterales bacterium]